MASAPLINLREVLRKDIASLSHIAAELAAAQSARNQAHAAFMTAEMQAQHLFSQYDALRRSVLERQAALRIMATDALPDDVLAEIFLHTMACPVVPAWQPGPTVDAPSVDIDGARAMVPWRIAHVSKRWRAVAMHTPRLWVYVAILDHEYTDRTRIVAYVKHMLEHSKNCLLDVAITVRNVDDPMDTEEEDRYFWDPERKPRHVYEQHAHMASVFKFLYTNVSRIRSFQICAAVNGPLGAKLAKKYYLEDVRELAAGLCCLPTSALEEACLVFNNGKDDSELHSTTIDLTLPVAPKLRRLRVDHAPALRRTPHPGFPVLEALSITSSYLPLADIWRCFSLCPALVDLYLDVDECQVDGSETTPSTLPAVRGMTVKGNDLGDFVDLAGNGILPLRNLTSLGLAGGYLLPEMLYEVKDRLVTFSVLGMLGEDEIEAISHLDAVEHVSISSDRAVFYGPLMEALRADDPPLWPKLKTFELFLPHHHFEDCGEALICVVKKRTVMASSDPPTVAPLERITVNKAHRVANWVIAELRAHLGHENVVVLGDQSRTVHAP
ncbi:hypothetical protein AURDEDRAFT_127236 [Auricularia subglabra TFB-10046 SS5]|nr:hypothetical protein AURDEDRAFT_127236 [Auricularia subglabra TFB-10046 SS5]